MRAPTELPLKLWLGLAPDQPDLAALAALSAAEQSACQRLATPELRARYIHAHSLLRNALAESTGLPPAQQRIVAGHNRRPQWHPELRQLQASLDFNLSYSGPLVACAVAGHARVGVDVEVVDARLELQRLVPRVTTAAERDWLNSLHPEVQRRAFFSLWVLKEAWAKARGEGLGLPFDAVSLIPNNDGGVEAQLEAAGDQSADWSFFRYRVSHGEPGDARMEAELALALNPARFVPPTLVVADDLDVLRY